jgi:hypothetical protein
MHKALLLLAIFGLAGPLWAADPIIGTWKLNIGKSKGPEGRHKELTEVYKELDSGLIELTRTGTEMDGSPISGKYIYPKQGGEAKIIDRIPSKMILSKAGSEGKIIGIFVGTGEWYTTFLRDGKQVQLAHKVISEDGKTMQVTYTRITPQDDDFEEVQVFDKQ